MDNVRELTVDTVLYPARKPYKTSWIAVGDGHELYYQEYGNPNGAAALVVHGGPGGAILESSRSTRTHDPSYFRIICVDQRGCGKSTPHVAVDRKGGLYKNTPDKLVEDFEKVRLALEVDHWHVQWVLLGQHLGHTLRHPPSRPLPLTGNRRHMDAYARRN